MWEVLSSPLDLELITWSTDVFRELCPSLAQGDGRGAVAGPLLLGSQVQESELEGAGGSDRAWGRAEREATRSELASPQLPAPS